MKRVGKMLMTLSLSALMVSVAACGNSNNKEAATGDASQSPSQTAVQSPSASPDQKNEVVTVSTVRKSDPYLKFDEGEDFDHNSVYDAYEKDAGVKITNKWVADDSQFKEKVKMAIATNDLPDFMPVSATQLKQLVEADMIMDLTDLYDKNATQNTKDFMVRDGGLQMKSATYDGKLMAIPMTGNPFNYQFLWVRTDWLKKLNLPEPKTMQDVMNIAEAFATKDPGGTGKSYGMAFNKSLYEGSAIGTWNGAESFTGFLNGFGAYTKLWYDDGSGQLVKGDVQPQMKVALKALQDMFKKGLIDPEFAVKDDQKEGELIFNNKIGLVYGPQWMPAYLAAGAVKDNKVVQEWGVFPIPSVDGTPGKSQMGLGTDDYYVVSKKAKNPEGVIKLLNNWIVVDNNQTEENKVYEFGKDRVEKSSNYWLLNPLTVYNQTNNNGEILPKAIENKDESLLQTKDQKGRYARAMKALGGDNSVWWELLISGPKGASSLVPDLQKNERFMRDKFYGAPTPAMVEKEAILNTKRDEIFVKIIMNQVSIDEFDKFVAEWKKLGGDQMTKEVNEWYAQNK
ncbi:extracellular solute-binding protein [Cohnella soli]|uniref:Extracellular solute-binding protein n=1 Tax=Cohnella soli TaxID=425005 RepID=A0ABW0I344_9BACL